MGHAELTLHDQAATTRISLDEYWMPFTPNREFKADPQMVVRAEGMYYWNDRGDKIIDASSGLFCVAAGHGRKEIADAVGKQLRELDFCAPFLRGASEAVRARDARRRAHAGRPQPHLLRQLRLRGGRHGDEDRARLPPGARPGRAQHVRLARARLSRRQLRRRRAVGPRQQPAQVRPGAARHRAHAPHAPQGEPLHAGRRRARRRARRGPRCASSTSTAPRTSPPASSSRSPGSTGCLVPPKGYLEAPARDLRRARHPARVRRGDHAASAAPARRSPRRASASRPTS